MKSVIKDIFHGFRGHIETMQMPKDHFENSGSKLCDAYDALKDKLSPELAELHEKYVNAIEGNSSEEIDFYFVEGFKLGLLIGLECVAD